VLEQLDILGEEVVPVLRREFAALKPAHVPDRAHPPQPWSRPAARQTRTYGPARPLRETKRDRDQRTTEVTARYDDPHPRRRHRRPVGPVVHPACVAEPSDGGSRSPPSRARGDSATAEVVGAARARAATLAEQPRHRFPNASLPRRGLEDRDGADALSAVTPVFARPVQRAVQDVLDVVEEGGRAFAGKPVLSRDGGDAAPLARPRARDAAAVRLPQRGGRADRGLRHRRGLGRRWRRGAGGARRARGGELADLVAARAPAAPADPFAGATPFTDLLGEL
jgi:hypothetical protein